MKWLENALSSLLLCQKALQYYQPTQEERKSQLGGDELNSDEFKGDLKERTGTSNPLLALLLHRLLAILKQLAATAMKKRYVCVLYVQKTLRK